MPEKVCFYCIENSCGAVYICPMCRTKYDILKREYEWIRRQNEFNRKGFFKLSKENEKLRAGIAQISAENDQFKAKVGKGTKCPKKL